MHPTPLFAFSAILSSALLLLPLRSWLLVRRRRRAKQLVQERQDADRALETELDDELEQARFSYRPATRELVLDERAACLHGLTGPPGSITVDGWQQLPATALAAGWIDRALADGLALGQSVHCEYLARTPGGAGRHMILKAIPLPVAGLLVGAIAHRPRSNFHETPLRARWNSAKVGESVFAERDRSWLPSPRPEGLC